MNKRCAVPLARPLALVLTRAAERPRNNARARSPLRARGQMVAHYVSLFLPLFRSLGSGELRQGRLVSNSCEDYDRSAKLED